MKKWVGGENIKGKVLRDWERWWKMEKYFLEDKNMNEREIVDEVRIKILEIGMEEDKWGKSDEVKNFID